MMSQPTYTDCKNCGTSNHVDYSCPCACHAYGPCVYGTKQPGFLPKAIKLADLKRIKVGRKLRLVYCLMGPCDKARTVAAVNSVGIQFSGDGISEGRYSHLSFPKASELLGDQSMFTIMEGSKVAAQYVVVDWRTDPLF